MSWYYNTLSRWYFMFWKYASLVIIIIEPYKNFFIPGFLTITKRHPTVHAKLKIENHNLKWGLDKHVVWEKRIGLYFHVPLTYPMRSDISVEVHFHQQWILPVLPSLVAIRWSQHGYILSWHSLYSLVYLQ